MAYGLWPRGAIKPQQSPVSYLLAHKRFEKSGTPLGRVTVFQATVKDSRVWTPYRPGARWENEKKIWPKVLSVDLGKFPPPGTVLGRAEPLADQKF